MTTPVELGPFSWERVIRAVKKVRERLERAARALDEAGIPYAVAGGNAVAQWVSRVDEAAVRNTQDVDVLVLRSDLPAVTRALEAAGFVHRRAAGIDMFLDGPVGRERESHKVWISGERLRATAILPAPDLDECETIDGLPVLGLRPLVEMCLSTSTVEDRMLVRDLIDVGLVDATWPARYPPELAARLQDLLDTPDG